MDTVDLTIVDCLVLLHPETALSYGKSLSDLMTCFLRNPRPDDESFVSTEKDRQSYLSKRFHRTPVKVGDWKG